MKDQNSLLHAFERDYRARHCAELLAGVLKISSESVKKEKKNRGGKVCD